MSAAPQDPRPGTAHWSSSLKTNHLIKGVTA
jgi:hypothetical protein